MLKFVPHANSASVPPISAKGRFSMMSSASPTDWKAPKSRMKMMKTTSGTIT